MKQLLYFLIGFSISVFGIGLSYACNPSISSVAQGVIDNSSCEKVYYYADYGSLTLAYQAYWANVSPWCRSKGNGVDYIKITNIANGPGLEMGWNKYVAFVVNGCGDPSTIDSDGDGVIDDLDLKPNSSESYKAAIVSVCYDSNNKVVAGVIQDGEGNQYSFGTMPTDFEGYTIDSVTGDLMTYQTPEDLAASLEKLNIDDLNITNQNKPIEIQDDGTIIPGSTDPFKDYKDKEDDQTEAKKPDTEATPTAQPDSNDGDSDRYDKIIKNTAATNTNLDNIQKYLGITNDYLAKINGKSSSSSKSSSSAVVNVETPTADEIGQAVENKLIDSGQTIDKTITDNISDLDKTDALSSIKTKYSDRYTSFITTLKESDLFSLPFGIFDGPSGSGASMQTVNIGKWGSSNEQTATIDYSNYDNIWEILRSVLLLLTSFSCFKILVLKKG